MYKNFAFDKCFKMGSSLCPHLVQEYFERVSDILTTYRAQILKQVEYDKISENLVLRGALRPEEHERIYKCGGGEGQVSQMLVVIQNRMWGLENLLAVFMEEHISPWLTQEIFRAYNEHVVTALRQQRDKRICQCVRMSNSILYKGWVNALQSLDSWIHKTGTLLGFMNQSLYPNDNMLAFLSEKLAEFSGGDSRSQQSDDLLPYGFSPNSTGEVQVAELEEDDININLISLSETLCIGYPAANDEEQVNNIKISASSSVPLPPKVSKKVDGNEFQSNRAQLRPNITKPVERKAATRKTSKDDTDEKKGTNGLTKASEIAAITSINSDSISEKQLKQRDLISRLSAPKGTKHSPPTSSKQSTISRQQSISSDNNQKSKTANQRPKSMEFVRSATLSPRSSDSVTTSTSSLSTTSNGSTSRKSDKNVTTTVVGKTKGFVRSKSTVPTSPKAMTKLSSRTRPTAVAKPTLKSGKEQNEDTTNLKKVVASKAVEENFSDDLINGRFACSAKLITQTARDLTDDSCVDVIEAEDIYYDVFEDEDDDEDDFPKLPSEMSTKFLCNRTCSLEEQQKNLGYYHLNFDEFAND